MISNDNYFDEHMSAAALIEPLDDLSVSKQALEDAGVEKPKSRPAIVRYWNKEHVDRIMGESFEIITIRATCPESNDQEEFPINKGLLCQFSAYFRAVFMGGFAESTQKSLDINLRPDDMWVFSKWLSSVLVRLYTFADYHDIPALRRAISLKFASPYEWERFDTRVTELQVGTCLAELPTTSPFYRWLVEHWAHCNSNRLGPCYLLNKKVRKPDPSTYRKPSVWP
ncbi:hypothetical protein KCV05_g1049, partial [Aureobasidium melanogenum]